MSMNESKLWKNIKDVVKTHKSWHFFRLESSTINGIPDVYACMDGNAFWIELKATDVKNKGISKFQWNWHIDHQRARGKSFILNAYTKESCLEVLVLREPRTIDHIAKYHIDHKRTISETITMCLHTMANHNHNHIHHNHNDNHNHTSTHIHNL